MFQEIWQRIEVYWHSQLDAALRWNPLANWIAAGATTVAVFLVLWVVKGFLTRRFSRWAEQSDRHALRTVAEIGRGTRLWFLLVVALFCGSLLLQMPEETRFIINSLTIAVVLLQSGFWGNKLLGFGVERFVQVSAEDKGAGKMTASAITLIGGIALWSIVLLAILGNFGVDVTALVAGLGVGGIAIALAAQNILGDLFASLSIVLDKPFVLGDFIVVGNEMGNVERVGLKTTRVRSLSGEQLVFANTDLLQSRIRNYKRMEQRRIVFTIGICYETPADKVMALPAMLREIVTAQPQARFDRAHFKAYGDFSLTYEVVYYVLSPDFTRYMDIQQAINFAILEKLQSEGIAFAYPTQSLYLHRQTAADS